jgi:ribosomal protein S4E
MFTTHVSVLRLYSALQFKLCKVRSVQFGQKGVPSLNTYDGRTIRYPDPLIKANDTIKIELETNKIVQTSTAS